MKKKLNMVVGVLFTSILLTAGAVSAQEMMIENNLGLGSSGAQVVDLQTTLESKGFLVIPEGVSKGRFGPLTKRALMKYQQSLGVYASGSYGPLTRASMKAMMKGGAMMEKKDGAMMKKDVMIKNEGAMMKKEGDSMMNKDAMTKEDLMKKIAMINDQIMVQKEAMTKEAMMKKDGAMMEKKDVMTAHAGVYETYSADKVVNAKGKVVLFFRASWCPTCRGVDTDIRAHLGSIPSGVQILDVDYDNSTALKSKYGVTYQHTFVQVDTQGNQLKKWSGSSTLSALSAEII